MCMGGKSAPAPPPAPVAAPPPPSQLESQKAGDQAKVDAAKRAAASGLASTNVTGGMLGEIGSGNLGKPTLGA